MTSEAKCKRCFTLLEVMVALALILIASGLTGWKMHQAVCKKRFQSDLDRLQSRLLICHRLSVAMQSDWKGVLTRQGKEWTFETFCPDAGEAKKWKPLRLHSFDLFLDGKKVQEFEIEFFSSGQILPEGNLLFSEEDRKAEWNLQEIFRIDSSGKDMKKGPLMASYGTDN